MQMPFSSAKWMISLAEKQCRCTCGKRCFHAAKKFFVPFDLQVRMQTALHQHAGAADLDRLADLLVDGLEIVDVTFGAAGPFRGVEGAEGAVLGAEIGVVDVAVDDVGGHALGMELATDRIGLHADADEVVGLEEVEGLGFGQCHAPLV